MFSDVTAGRWQISTGGGTRPLWERSRRELFYYVDPGRVMAVPIQPRPSFSAGNPQTLFEGQYLAPQGGQTYDVSPDGKRFLMIKSAAPAGETSTLPQLIVVLDWFEELKRLVPQKQAAGVRRRALNRHAARNGNFGAPLRRTFPAA